MKKKLLKDKFNGNILNERQKKQNRIHSENGIGNNGISMPKLNNYFKQAFRVFFNKVICRNTPKNTHTQMNEQNAEIMKSNDMKMIEKKSDGKNIVFIDGSFVFG